MSLIQSNHGSASAASSLAVVLPNPSPGGNRLIVAVFDYRPSTGATLTFTSALGITYTPITGATVDAAATVRAQLFSGVVPVGGGTETVTAGYGGVNQTSIVVAVSEIPSTFVDQGNGATGTSTALNSGNVTTGFKPELIFCFGLQSSVLSVGTNETFAFEENGSTYATEAAVKNTVGVTSGQFTAVSSALWLCVVATFPPFVFEEEVLGPLPTRVEPPFIVTYS